MRVATTEGFARALIVPALAALTREHPQLQVEIMANPVRLDITRRQAYLAVGVGCPIDPDVICCKLGDCGFALYRPRSNRAAHHSPGRAKDLSARVAVSYLGAPTWFGATLGGARVALFSNSPFVQMEAVSQGIGIGLFPCFLGDSDPAFERNAVEQPEPRLIWMVIHRPHALRENPPRSRRDRRDIPSQPADAARRCSQDMSGGAASRELLRVVKLLS